MRLRRQLTGLPLHPRLPRRTIRVRLALSYWVLFVTSGAALLAVTVALWQGKTTGTAPANGTGSGNPFQGPGLGPHSGGGGPQHVSDLRQLLVVCVIALAMMAVVSIVFGWLVAGRFLRPMRAITTTAKEISANNLHERLNLAGPDDDLKELADTFDDLLARLERSFQSERRFVANASHELRTPLATMRVWLDVALAKPGPVSPQTIALAGRLRPELDRIDRLLESFLTLAHTQQGPPGDQCTLSLGELASAAIERHAGAISHLALWVDQEEGAPAWVTGSETLLSRMVENVIDNAVKHNEPRGWLLVNTDVQGRFARLIVENGGVVLAQVDIAQLAQPFRRLAPERTGSETGTGLGLSIVESIAEVHGGTLELRARAGGGVRAIITLPLAVAAVTGDRAIEVGG